MNGGVGKVKPIQMVQPMLITQAVSSKQNLSGWAA
jgi:hypothetical protein